MAYITKSYEQSLQRFKAEMLEQLLRLEGLTDQEEAADLEKLAKALEEKIASQPEVLTPEKVESAWKEFSAVLENFTNAGGATASLEKKLTDAIAKFDRASDLSVLRSLLPAIF